MKVFYDPRQSALNNDSFSPSACKPAKVVESWGKLGIPFDIESFPPMTAQDIALVHEPDYVDGVLACTAENGFGNKSPEVATTLPWVCGSMVASALYTLQTGETSFSPTWEKLIVNASQSSTSFRTINSSMTRKAIRLAVLPGKYSSASHCT